MDHKVLVYLHVIIYLHLLPSGLLSPLKITRSITGDSYIGFRGKCTGTLVVRNDSTRSIFCANTMDVINADCNFFFNRTRKIGIAEQEIVERSETRVITKRVSDTPFCRTGYRPMVGQLQLQDYPPSYEYSIWNSSLGNIINKSLDLAFNEKEDQLNVKFWDNFPGMLVRLYIDCKMSNGTVDPKQSNKQCVIFKYTGTAALPVPTNYFVTFNTAPSHRTNPTNPTTTSNVGNTPIPPAGTTTTSNVGNTPIPPAGTTTTSNVGNTPKPPAGPTTNNANSTLDEAPNESESTSDGDHGIPWKVILISAGAFLLIVIVITIVVCVVCTRRNKSKEKEIDIKMNSLAESRDNPAFIRTISNSKQQYPSAEYATVNKNNKNTSSVKETETVDGPDGDRVTSSAYVFIKSPKTSTEKLDPVSIKIVLDEDDCNNIPRTDL